MTRIAIRSGTAVVSMYLLIVLGLLSWACFAARDDSFAFLLPFIAVQPLFSLLFGYESRGIAMDIALTLAVACLQAVALFSLVAGGMTVFGWLWKKLRPDHPRT